MTDKEYQRAHITIGKDILAYMPAEEFSGKICVIDTLDKVESAVQDLRTADIIGFDTETRPSFHKGQNYNVSLVQLSTPDCCYLFRTNIIGWPEELIKIFEDPNLKKVGLSLHDDFHNIRKQLEFEPKSFIDLQSYVKQFKIADISLSRIYGILFGKRISKGQRLTNWETNNLSVAQLNYAALDAWACIKIYQFLEKGLFEPKKSMFLTLPEEPNEEATPNK